MSSYRVNIVIAQSRNPVSTSGCGVQQKYAKGESGDWVVNDEIRRLIGLSPYPFFSVYGFLAYSVL